MKTNIIVPSPGESIHEVVLAKWLAKNGDFVEKNQEIAEVESDKATLTISAEVSGIIEIQVEEGKTIEVGSIIGTINTEVQASMQSNLLPNESQHTTSTTAETSIKSNTHITPLAKKLIDEYAIPEQQLPTDKNRITTEDIKQLLNSSVNISTNTVNTNFSRTERSEPLSPLRKKLSERLLQTKNQTAMLTTFNEVDMSALLEIRNQYKTLFEQKHGIKLGILSFFAKAATIALLEHPKVNSTLTNDYLVYHDYIDLSIAVQTDRGLVVPVIRNAESKSLVDIEKEIHLLAEKARAKKLSIDELEGGTFSITNGGTFGSLLATPLLNFPQTAILGMHSIQERPVVVNHQIVIRPMMYIALSYDHRVLDGKDSILFLKRIKELIESPFTMSQENNIEKLLSL